MKYKVGDRVRIKSIEWYNRNKNKFGKVWCANGHIPFDKDMSKYCGKVMTISHVRADHYTMVEDLANYWTDEMIECKVEEDPNDCEKCGLIRNSTKCLFMDNCPHNKQKNIIEIPEDYVIKDENGNVINATKIVLEKKEKSYPKTYEECCYVLGFENTELVFEDDYRDINPPKEQWKRLGLINQFNKLLICRDAYWKIAGEEMGLEKPWEPDFDNENEYKYGLFRLRNIIYKDVTCINPTLLIFPTKEMRDAFYEVFREEIEICKELL